MMLVCVCVCVCVCVLLRLYLFYASAVNRKKGEKKLCFLVFVFVSLFFRFVMLAFSYLANAACL